MTDKTQIEIRQARIQHAEGITECVNLAYANYIPRMGQKPGPMLDDYSEVVNRHRVFVALDGESVIGVVVLIRKQDGILLDNIAVHPASHGLGIGRRLLTFAENWCRDNGFATVELYTHEKMTENIVMYLRYGYCETARREESGFQRIYFEKQLS